MTEKSTKRSKCNNILKVLFSPWVTIPGTLFVQNPSDSIRIDSVGISRNWITWDRILKDELLFQEGDWVRYGEIDTSMNKVWNIGNFANVEYSLEAGPDGNVIQIKALDAPQIYPVLVIDHSGDEDNNYRLGIGDKYLLGSKSELKIVWNKKPTGTTWDFHFRLSRLLMYKNMTVEFGTTVGLDKRIFYEREEAEYITLMIAPYHKLDTYTTIGNPWHLDYRYLFSLIWPCDS